MSGPVKVQGLPSPDTDKEPSNLKYKKAIKDQLLNDEIIENAYDGDSIPTTDINSSVTKDSINKFRLAPPGVEKNPLELLAEAIQCMDSNELIEVKGPFGKIAFRAMHVSSNEHGMAFIVLKDRMTYEPNVGTNLVIKHSGIETEVVYAGGYFTFKQMPFTFLSFIKLKAKEDE